MVFGQADQIVKITGQQNDEQIRRLPPRYLLRGVPDAANMGNIMRGIAAKLVGFKPELNVLLPCG